MGTLQRPPTIREFVIRSILRGAADADEEATTAVCDGGDRDTVVDPPPSARPAYDSIVFDLASVPA
jgi:hypothetical protein